MYRKINLKKKSVKVLFGLCFLVFITYFAVHTVYSRISNPNIEQKIQNISNADIEVQLAKEKMKEKLENSKKFKSEIVKETEYCILTVNDSFEKTYDENPDVNFFTSWAVKKKITLFINYSSKYILPTENLTCYIEDNGVVSFVFNKDNIYVHTKLLKTSEKTEKGFFKSNFTNAELLALQEISSECIDQSLLNNDSNYQKAFDSFTLFLVNEANNYNVDEIRVNGEIINVSTYLKK